MSLIIRSHERMDYKRCQKRWYWSWRLGLTPKRQQFGALALGTWVHYALASWYVPGYERNGSLVKHFNTFADMGLALAQKERAPQYVVEQAEELAALGEAMMRAYESHYDGDENVTVIGSEIPLDFSFGTAVHRLKPDLVYIDEQGYVWLMEHKTAAQIRVDHLKIDDQARPYGAMAEKALRKKGLLKPDQRFKGIMYNFMRKALPDTRDRDAAGKALNKDGTVSARQSPPNFVRHPVTMTAQAKALALRRVHAETLHITGVAQQLRDRTLSPESLFKTPTKDCPNYCQFFGICEAEEQGSDIGEMQDMMFVRRDPYAYEEDEDNS